MSLMNDVSHRDPGLGFVIKRRHVEQAAKRRDTHANLATPNGVGNRINGFQQQANAVFD